MTTARRAHGMGYTPDLMDFRDFRLEAPRAKRLPPRVDLRTTGFFPPVFDQGQLGSCTGNAIAGAFAFEVARQKEAAYVPSRLFIYYGERVIEHSVSQDSGAQIRDGMKVVSKQGAPHETLWKYSVSKFAQKPPAKAFADGLKHLATSYKRVNNAIPSQVLGVLAAGTPIVLGFTVYSSFMGDDVAATGIVPMPATDEEIEGGHAVVCCGYDQSAKTLLCRNSWGHWGDKGYFTAPMDYLLNTDLSDDWWVVESCS